MKTVLRDSSGSVVINQFSTACDSCIHACDSESSRVTCPIHNDERRIGKITKDIGSVFCCTTEQDLIKSSKVFKKSAESKLYGIEQLILMKERLNFENKKLLHNLTKTNGHNIQELYALVPQELLTQNIYKQLETIKSIILDDPIEAAKTFLRIAKNNAAMKTEFSVFNKLAVSTPVLHKKYHHFKRVTLNLFHIFFQKFKERNVYVAFEENDAHLLIDYESVHVSLYHLIDNATKYILPNTTLSVRFRTGKGGTFTIILDMISLRIEEEEIDFILEEGFSGINAKNLKKSGDGIGLGRVSRILSVNNAELEILARVDESKSCQFEEFWYDNNQFSVKFINAYPRV